MRNNNQLFRALRWLELSIATTVISLIYWGYVTADSAYSLYAILCGNYYGFLYYKIYTLKNWARLVLLFTVSGALPYTILFFFITYLNFTLPNWGVTYGMFTIMNIVWLITTFRALYLLFAPPISTLFNGTKKQILYVSVAGFIVGVLFTAFVVSLAMSS